MEVLKPLYEWNTMEYVPQKKSVDWYWAIGIIAVSATVASLIYNNFLFAVFVIVGTASLILFQIRKPRQIHVALFPQGIKIDSYLYPYDSMKSFWIEDSHPRLHLASTRFISPAIIIPLEEANLNQVHNILSDNLEEKEVKPTLMNALVDRLGF